MNSPTSVSPIDLERHNPPGQHRRGPTLKRESEEQLTTKSTSRRASKECRYNAVS
jgi:hypothetical protein